MATPIQTKREIHDLLTQAGLAPDKRFGQHFLIDANLLRKLLASTALNPGDTILEVGGGTGSLSEQLAEGAGKVVVVEIDRRLAPLLKDRLARFENVTVLCCDALDGKNRIATEVLDALHARPPGPGGAVKLVANLPYNAGTPVLMNLLTAAPRVERMCFTIQRELGERMLASSGSREFGPLAIAMQTVCTIQRVARLPGSVFWPPPNVESVMLQLVRRAHPFETGEQLPRFLELVHAAFAHRRKTLRYNLARVLTEPQCATAGSVLDLAARAESIPLTTWHTLGAALLST